MSEAKGRTPHAGCSIVLPFDRLSDFSNYCQSASCRHCPCRHQQQQLDMDVTTVPQINSLNDLIRELYNIFEDDHINVEQVHDLMASYKSNPSDWKKFAKFDRYRYTRNLIDEGNGKFNLMLLCWGPSHTSTIHDHADAHCFMKMLSGSLQEVRFDWPNKDQIEAEDERSEMREIDRGTLKINDVCYINDSLGLHRVENASHTEGAVSLHLYCPPFNSCCMFDERTGKRTKCCVSFWSKFGQKVELKKAKSSS